MQGGGWEGTSEQGAEWEKREREISRAHLRHVGFIQSGILGHEL